MSAEPISILHADDDLVVVSKPPGMAVHRDRGSGRRERFLLQAVSEQTGQYVYPVHRLDRNTSGLLCFALSRDAARTMQQTLADPETIKTYLVLARGETPEVFASDRPLTNDRGEPCAARTEFRRLATLSRCSLLETRLRTGRHHQIRRHLNHLAHHVIGDTTHGKGKINAYFREHHGLPRMFIHAWRLELAHPRAGTLSLVDPLAPDLAAFLRRLPDFDESMLPV